MRNDTQSDKGRSVLRLVNSSDGPEALPEASYQEDLRRSITSALTNRWVFIAVGAACAVGAVAAGSYAVWLSRKKDSESALLDVQEIVRHCEAGVAQLEAQIARIAEAAN